MKNIIHDSSEFGKCRRAAMIALAVVVLAMAVGSMASAAVIKEWKMSMWPVSTGQNIHLDADGNEWGFYSTAWQWNNEPTTYNDWSKYAPMIDATTKFTPAHTFWCVGNSAPGYNIPRAFGAGDGAQCLAAMANANGTGGWLRYGEAVMSFKPSIPGVYSMEGLPYVRDGSGSGFIEIHIGKFDSNGVWTSLEEVYAIHNTYTGWLSTYPGLQNFALNAGDRLVFAVAAQGDPDANHTAIVELYADTDTRKPRIMLNEYAADLVTINANVNLEHYNGDFSLLNVRVDLLQNGVVKKTQTVVPTSGTVAVSFPQLASGTYQVRASAAKFLTQQKTVTLSAAQTVPVSLSLRNGDIDGDGAVTAADHSILSGNFDQVGD